MKIKTENLIGPALDWAVIVALYGKHDASNPKHVAHFNEIRAAHVLHQQAHYSTNWSQGGPIIEREKIDVVVHAGKHSANGDQWRAMDSNEVDYFGPTPLIAAMRCFVASKLGDTIEIPEELA